MSCQINVSHVMKNTDTPDYEKSTSLDDITKDQLEDLFLNAGTVQMVVNNSMHVVDQFLPKAM